MNFQHIARTCRALPYIVRLCAIASIWASSLVTIAYADPVVAEWRKETQFYVTGISNFRRMGGSNTAFQTFAATGELKFSSRARRYSASLFADYRYSESEFATDNVNIGGLFKYNLDRWDATAFLFVATTPRTDPNWIYAGRLRYRFADGHKLGIEATGSLSYKDSPSLMLGYYGSLTDALSLNVVADPGINKGPDAAARIELVWQLR
jgi:hypothetical protein